MAVKNLTLKDYKKIYDLILRVTLDIDHIVHTASDDNIGNDEIEKCKYAIEMANEFGISGTKATAKWILDEKWKIKDGIIMTREKAINEINEFANDMDCSFDEAALDCLLTFYEAAGIEEGPLLFEFGEMNTEQLIDAYIQMYSEV